MLTFDIMGTKCTINLNNGVYRMDLDSATGKSFIVYLLNRANYVGVVKAVTYDKDDYMHNKSLSSILGIVDSNVQIVVLDDIDFYADEVTRDVVKQLQSIAEHSIVLLDSKYEPSSLSSFCKFVRIEMRKDEINVNWL